MLLQLVIDTQAEVYCLKIYLKNSGGISCMLLKALELSCLAEMTLLPQLRVLFSDESVLQYLLALSEA